MKLVGEAVRGYSGSNVTTVGIASWGIIKNKDKLLRPRSKKLVSLFVTYTGYIFIIDSNASETL